MPETPREFGERKSREEFNGRSAVSAVRPLNTIFQIDDENNKDFANSGCTAPKAERPLKRRVPIFRGKEQENT